MISAVTPQSNGFGGGSYTPAGRPTAVGGSLGAPGTAAGTPPGVPSSGIIEARNNKGSNVQIPYARLVPMHSRENIQASAMATRNNNAMMKDTRLLTVNGTPQLEYDGLQQGELAWILGRRFKSAVDPKQGAAANGISEYSDAGRYTQQAFAGLGSGVDRMQRLASTGWVESLFRERIGSARIELHEIRLDSPYAMAMDSSLAAYKPYLAGANVLQCPDITWWRAQLEGNPALAGGNPSIGFNQGRRLQGINVLDTSPFLRGVQVDSSVVRFEKKRVPGAVMPEDMARNMGDLLCMSVLETELRRRNIMDWTPDGIVLSKLESPSGEQMTSTAIDARQAQLFNVGIQGPSITKSWTSDIRDSKLEVQPMDKVFVVVVARLSYIVNNTGNSAYVVLRRAQQQVLELMKAHRIALEKKQSTRVSEFKAKLEKQMEKAKNAADEYANAIRKSPDPKYVQAMKDLKNATDAVNAAAPADKQKAQDDLGKAQQAIKDAFKMDNTEYNNLVQEIQKVRTNQKTVTKAILSDFRLMRTTSSHMANYSYFKPGDEKSRLGLGIGHVTTGGNSEGVKDVIVGGWCIGTVVDSAASRSTIGFQTVKSHPTSMAININVNVQWWSGDRLYKHYHDTGGLVLMRGQKRPLAPGSTNIKPMPEEDLDAQVPLANQGRKAAPAIGASTDANVGELIPPLEDDGLDPDHPPLQRQRVDTDQSAFGTSASSAAAGAPRARPGQSRRA